MSEIADGVGDGWIHETYSVGVGDLAYPLTRKRH